MQCKGIATLWKFHEERIRSPFAAVIFREFCPKPTCLDSNHGVKLWIEVCLAAQDLRGNLVFLYLDSGMFDGLFGEIR